MGKVLDRLGERLWLPWLICLGIAGVLLLMPETYEFIELFIGLALAAFLGVVLFDYGYRRTQISDGLHEEDWTNRLRLKRDWLLASLASLSIVLMFAAMAVDRDTGLVLPLAASVGIPSMLRLRREAVSFLASRQPAS